MNTTIKWFLIGIWFSLPAVANIQGQKVTWGMWIVSVILIVGMTISFQIDDILNEIKRSKQ